MKCKETLLWVTGRSRRGKAGRRLGGGPVASPRLASGSGAKRQGSAWLGAALTPSRHGQSKRSILLIGVNVYLLGTRRGGGGCHSLSRPASKQGGKQEGSLVIPHLVSISQIGVIGSMLPHTSFHVNKIWDHLSLSGAGHQLFWPFAKNGNEFRLHSWISECLWNSANFHWISEALTDPNLEWIESMISLNDWKQGKSSHYLHRILNTIHACPCTEN